MRYAEPGRGGRSRTDLAVTAVLLGCALLVAGLGGDRQATLARAVRSSVLVPFLELHRAFAERARVGQRLRAVRAERDSLAAEAVRLRQLAGDGRELRRLSGLETPSAGTFLAADLLAGRPRVGDSDIFQLRGPGLADVPVPAAVITGSGLVGVLRSVDARGGHGEFWTHPDFRVSVRTEEGGTSGIVRAMRGPGGQAVMLLEGAPYQGDVPPGTELFTTGLAGIYPPGVPVGTVTGVSRVESGWAKSYFVRPAVRPEAASVVLVWRRREAAGP